MSREMHEPKGHFSKGSWNRAKSAEQKEKYKEGHERIFGQQSTRLNGGCDHNWVESDVDGMETCTECGRYRSKP